VRSPVNSALFEAPSTIGARGANTTAGQMFGGIVGGVRGVPLLNASPRWGLVNCELAYRLHRLRSNGNLGTQPFGRVVICFDDLHVGVFSDRDLVDPVTGVATGVAAWSPKDFMRN